MRSALLTGAGRHRTVLLAAGAVLMALLAVATTPHGRGGHIGLQPQFLRGSTDAGSSAASNVTGQVTGGASIVSPDHALKVGSGLPSPISPTVQGAAAGTIAARLAVGQRAFAIRVAEDDIVGGFLQSGDRVDVLATIPGSVFPQKDALATQDRSNVLLLLQNIPVLAVGGSLVRTGAVQTDARTVSLSLAPDQLVRLTLALRLGRVSLAIRRPDDNAVSGVTGADLTDLLPALRPSAPTPEPHHVQASVHAASHQIPFFAGTRTTAMAQGGRP